MSVLLLDALMLGAFGSDDDGYHMTAPRRWLADGFLSYLPTYSNTNASAGFEMIYVLGLSSGNAGLKIIHFSAGLFCLLSLWLCARRMGSSHAGTIAVSCLLIATPVCNVPILFGWAFVDFGATWMMLASVLVWLIWRSNPAEPGRRLLIVLALLTGFAASFKSTALTVAVAWTPVLIWEARRRGLGWLKIVTGTFGLGAVAFLPVSPWMFRSWNLTGNPVFPMLSNLIPTRDWNPDMAAVFGKYVHYYSWGVASNLSENLRKAIVAMTAGLALISGVAVVARAKDPAIRGLIGFSTIVFLMTLAVLGMYFRYWLPAEMCVVLVCAVALVRRYAMSTTVLWLPSGLMAVALAINLAKQIQHPEGLYSRLRVATGNSSLDDEYASNAAWNMWRFINGTVANDAHILVGSFYTSVGASNYGCFWLEARCFTTDSYIQTFIDMRNWQSFVHTVNNAGIHYLLIYDKQYLPNRIGFSFAAGDNEYSFCRRLADQYGKKVAQFDSMQLYSLGPIPESL